MRCHKKLPKEAIKKLAATGLSKSAIAAALDINEKYFEAALKADEVFSNLVDKLIMDYYLQADASARHGCLSPELTNIGQKPNGGTFIRSTTQTQRHR